MKKLSIATILLLSASLMSAASKKQDKITLGAPETPTIASQPLPAVATPSGAQGSRLAVTSFAVAAAAAPVYGAAPRDMKLLVLAATGQEPSFQAITFFLGYLGIPYEAVIRNTTPLPVLALAGKGNYQGILLATGNLAFCDSAGCRSALTADDWTALDTYTRDYGVRTVAWYAWPEPRYGLTLFGNTGYSTDVTAANMAYTAASATVFPYLNRANPLKVKGAYYYPTTATPAAGETTTPLLTINGYPVAALHTKADGREYMAFTFDSNPYLTHSMAIQYGALNWVTKGIFLGSRKIYAMPQSDDHFLENDMFELGKPACMPGSALTNDPTFDPGTVCQTDRMDSNDLKNIAAWQDKWNLNAQFKGFKLTMAYNGYGTAAKYGGDPDNPNNDNLSSSTITYKGKFFWVNHTYDHEVLDCFLPVPNSGICRPATYAESVTEIKKNVDVARAMGIALDTTAMVTPGISGLTNPAFMQAAFDQGLRYLAGDMSRPEGQPANPNTGIRNALQPSILIVPRRASSIYYNTVSAFPADIGSQPDEYNYFYGPNGIFKFNGLPWYSTTQTWAQIVDRESDALVTYMLRGELYPVMFHQSNLIRYSGSKTLLTEVLDMAFNKFAAISNLPVVSLSHSDTGRAMQNRMSFLEGGVTAVLTPGVSIQLTAARSAVVPVTGLCVSACESYGGQSLSSISLRAGSVNLPVR